MNFAKARFGVSSLEYGIIAAILGLVLVTTFHHFDQHLSTLFRHVGASI